jgi:WD40 repeat protein
LTFEPQCLGQETTERAVLKGHSATIYSLAFSPDGKLLASGSSDKTVRLWDVAAAKEKAVLPETIWVRALVFSPDGKTLASATGGLDGEKRLLPGNITLWDTATGKKRAVLEGHTAWILKISCSPDGKTLASASEDGTVKLWNMETGKEIATFKGGETIRWFSFVVFTQDGKTVVAASGGSKLQKDEVRKWDVETGKLKGILSEIWIGQVQTVSSEGKLAALAVSNEINLWDLETTKLKSTLKGHSTSVSYMAFLAGGKRLVSVDAFGSVKVWDLETNTEKFRFRLKTPLGLEPMALSPDGKIVATGSVLMNGEVKLWTVPEIK